MSQQTPKVLILENDSQSAKEYQQWIAGLGYEFRHSIDGSQGAAILRSEKFSAAIIQIKLPNMSGLQVAAVARSSQLNRDIPIFLITPEITAEASSRAQALGMVEVLQKPVSQATLTKVLSDALRPKPKASGYDVRIINAILQAASEVLQFYFSEDPKLSKPGVRKGASPTNSGATTLISISGQTFAGSLAIVAPMNFVHVLATKLLQSNDIKLDQDMLSDMMGELGNQVVGKIKSGFMQLGDSVI